MRIGIDIGGVIIDRSNDDEDTSLFGPNYLTAQPVAGAVEALRTLNVEIFPKEVYIVSKCGEKIEARSREWLKANQVHEKTGIPEANVHFCRDRAAKTPIARKLGLTHFVDDRLEVLGYMRGIVPHRILFGANPAGINRHGLTSGPVILAFSWKDVLECLTGSEKKLEASAVDKLKDFFILRQEFDAAKAIRDLDKIASTGEAVNDDAFIQGHNAMAELMEQQRFSEAGSLRALLDLAKRAVEARAKP